MLNKIFLWALLLGPLLSIESFGIITDPSELLNIDDSHPATYNTVALLDKNNNFFCSGSIISKNIILTAKHCFRGRDVKAVKVYFGDNTNVQDKDLIRESQRVEFFGRLSDSKFTFPSYDVAWVQFFGELPSGKKPINLLTDSSILKEVEKFHLAGFGESSLDKWKSVTGIKKVTTTKLDSYFKTNILNGLIRFSGKEGQGACSGDSGGPAYVIIDGNWYLAGVTNGFDVTLTPKSMIRTYKEQFPFEIDCSKNQSLYTFTGDLTNWLSETTDLRFERKDEQEVSTLHFLDFKDWCENIRYPQKGWVSVKALLEFAADNSSINSKTIFNNCEVAQNVLNKIESANFKSEYKLDSLEPFESLKFKSLYLMKRDLSKFDLSPLSRMKNLKKLTLTSLKLNDQSNVNILFSSKSITYLDLAFNELTKLEVRDENSVLQGLDLVGNTIREIENAQFLVALKYLYFQ